jgi:DNA-binding transcriptional ArsR family regulator
VDLIIKAINEPNRRAILQLVAFENLSAGEIAEHFSITRSAVSQHLGVLKEAGLVTEKRLGTKRFYRTCPERFRELHDFLNSFWDEKLFNLKAVIESSEAKN